MVTLAEFVFNLVLPTEDAGDKQIAGVHKDDRLVRGLFEKAVGNFLAAELGPAGWKVHPGQKLKWPTVDATPGLAAILPGMQTDIVLEHAGQGRRIILDTKFTGIFTRSRRRETMLKSGYVYQLYACLRSQAREDDRMSQQSEGLLLHPAIDADVDVSTLIQGHRLRFMTVVLASTNVEIAKRLREVVSRHCIEKISQP
jgi:5-methylcytosine-specific restriction enzyme subunit McrC